MSARFGVDLEHCNVRETNCFGQNLLADSPNDDDPCLKLGQKPHLSLLEYSGVPYESVWLSKADVLSLM